MDNSIRVSKQDDTTIITITGLLDNELAMNLSNIIEKSVPPVVIDLKQVSFIYTLGSLSIFNFYNEHQQKPKVKGVNPHVLSMLQLSGTARYVDIVDSPDPDNTTQSVQE